MSRYLRLYGAFVRFSFSRAMEFRIDFFFRFIMDCIYYAVNILFFNFLFGHTTALGGWSLEQVYVFMGGCFVIDAIHMTVFSTNIWWLPSFINKGDLDYHLVRPVSSLFFLSVREFAANSFMNLVIALSFWIWAILQLPMDWNWGRFILYVVLLLNGSFLFFLLQMLSVLPVFWTQSSRGFNSLFWTLEQFMERPHTIYAGWLRVILVTVLPYSLMASVPAEVFFGGASWGTLLNVIGVSAGLFGFVLWLWHKGLRSYSSASS